MIDGRRISYAVAALCALAACLSVLALWGEAQVARAAQALRTEDRQKSSGATSPPASNATARVKLIDGLRIARVAERTTDPVRRQRMLSTAHGLITAAAQVRPHWGECTLALAYVAWVGARGSDGAVTTLIARSYRQSPYLRNAAAWRIAAGLDGWAQLDDRTRAALIDEAVWMTGSSFAGQRAILQRMRRFPAYVRFFARWQQFRVVTAAPR